MTSSALVASVTLVPTPGMESGPHTVVWERWNRMTSSQCWVWGKRSTGTAATGEKGVPFTRRDGLRHRLLEYVGEGRDNWKGGGD